jgi:hypothetical protein
MKQYTRAIDKRAEVDAKLGWTIGRQPTKTAITWHWNGPTVAGVEAKTEAWHLWHVKSVIIPNHISRIHADGVQYHAYVLPNGEFWQLRDFDAVLWSTRDWEGNGYSINIHVPIGIGQIMTEAQKRTLVTESDEIIRQFGMVGRSRVFGHQEWKGAATDCPGPYMMAELKAYRAGSAGAGYFEVQWDNSLVREGPARSFPVALQGKARLRKGDVFLADEVKIGDNVNGENRWLHRADGLGFIHIAATKKVS